jgi:hypothetical protein
MKRFDAIRAAVVIAGLGASPAALADGGISTAGWASVIAIPVIVAVLFVVHKKLG